MNDDLEFKITTSAVDYLFYADAYGRLDVWEAAYYDPALNGKSNRTRTVQANGHFERYMLDEFKKTEAYDWLARQPADAWQIKAKCTKHDTPNGRRLNKGVLIYITDDPLKVRFNLMYASTPDQVAS